MKRIRNKILALVLLLLYAMFISHILLYSEPSCPIPESCGMLPSELQHLSDEAFAETALDTVIFADGIVYIGEHAFWNALHLSNVYIPESTYSIGVDAFPTSAIIHGIRGSFVQDWAEENGYRFVICNIWNTSMILQKIQTEQFLTLLVFLVPADLGKRLGRWRCISSFVRSMRPQDRPELFPINYRFP